jgi:hypothetical protein
MGVYSLSTKRGYRRWEGREAYNEWKFTERSLSGGTEEGQPGPGLGPGRPGSGGGGVQLPNPPGGGIPPRR